MLCPDISGVTTQIYCFNCVSESLPQILFFPPESQVRSNFPCITAECHLVPRDGLVAQVPAVSSVTPSVLPHGVLARSSYHLQVSALGKREKEEGFRTRNRKGCRVPRCTRSFDVNLGLSFLPHQLCCSAPGTSGLPAFYPLDSGSVSLAVTTRTCLHMLPQPLAENHFWISPLAMFPTVFNKFFNSSLRALTKPSPTTCPGGLNNALCTLFP